MDAKLKPCPLCGRKADGVSYVTEYAIRCTGCYVGLARRHHATDDGPAEAEAVAAWNRRVPQPQ